MAQAQKVQKRTKEDRALAKRRRAYREQNEVRAERITKLIGYPSTQGDSKQAVIDLLADIRHWCDEAKSQFYKLDRVAHMHYTAEVVQARTGEEQ